MRLIDADALLRNTIYNPSHVPYIAESDIIFAPTADVVEVVRCKDCEWFKTEHGWNGEEMKVCGLYLFSVLRDGDDYCSKAKRRE